MAPAKPHFDAACRVDSCLTGDISWQGKAGLPVQPFYVAHQLGIHLQLTVEQNLRFLLAFVWHQTKRRRP